MLPVQKGGGHCTRRHSLTHSLNTIPKRSWGPLLLQPVASVRPWQGVQVALQPVLPHPVAVGLPWQGVLVLLVLLQPLAVVVRLWRVVLVL